MGDSLFQHHGVAVPLASSQGRMFRLFFFSLLSFCIGHLHSLMHSLHFYKRLTQTLAHFLLCVLIRDRMDSFCFFSGPCLSFPVE